MKIFVVIISSLALVSVALSAEQENKKAGKAPPKKPAQTAQSGAHPNRGPKQGAPKAVGAHQQTNVPQHGMQGQGGAGARKGKAKEANQVNAGARQQVKTGPQNTKQKKGAQTGAPTGGQPAVGGAGAGKGKQGQANLTQAKPKPPKFQHFNVPKQPNTAKAPPVKFQPNRRIEGSQNWQGQKYSVFRNYKSQWHDQGWWHSHYGNHIVWAFGAPYYFNSGYWFPAWGYAPNAYYAWDGPIYAYNRLPPDQVIANVQAALRQQGYYHGEVDGLIGPLTRDAIANYQRDHGLYTTSTIDQPTLQSLGMA